MARRTLQRIEPLDPPIVPPANAKPAGLTPDGKQLYEEIRMMAFSVPDTDPQGNQRWRKHPTTGDPTYPLFKPDVRELVLLYYLESQGNGNVIRVMYKHPTPEEKAEMLRKQQISEMQTSLAEQLVDAGVTAAQLAAFIKGQTGIDLPPLEEDPAVSLVKVNSDPIESQTAAPVPEAATPAPELVEVYPIHIHGPNWQLSNGESFRGKRVEAEAAEQKIRDELKEAQARAAAAAEATPTY